MKTNHPVSVSSAVVAFAFAFALGSGACAARADDADGEAVAPAEATLTPATDPPSPWGDGDTMGDSFGKKSGGAVKHCPTGKQKLDCIKHCSGVDVDECISACASCY